MSKKIKIEISDYLGNRREEHDYECTETAKRIVDALDSSDFKPSSKDKREIRDLYGKYRSFGFEYGSTRAKIEIIDKILKEVFGE